MTNKTYTRTSIGGTVSRYWLQWSSGLEVGDREHPAYGVWIEDLRDGEITDTEFVELDVDATELAVPAEDGGYDHIGRPSDVTGLVAHVALVLGVGPDRVSIGSMPASDGYGGHYWPINVEGES
jgi:hypothetical protein